MSDTEIPDAIARLGQKPERIARGVRGRPARETSARDEDARSDVRETGPRLKRQRTRKVDRLEIPKNMVPPGVSYEWKRESIYGKPDSDHMNELMENHWRVVPEDRHPNFRIRRDGLVLMERPSYLTQEAQAEDLDIALAAVESVRNTLNETPQGTLTRNHPSAKANTYVRSGWGGGVPGDD